jgi:hypothetical protein
VRAGVGGVGGNGGEVNHRVRVGVGDQLPRDPLVGEIARAKAHALGAPGVGQAEVDADHLPPVVGEAFDDPTPRESTTASDDCRRHDTGASGERHKRTEAGAV